MCEGKSFIGKLFLQSIVYGRPGQGIFQCFSNGNSVCLINAMLIKIKGNIGRASIGTKIAPIYMLVSLLSMKMFKIAPIYMLVSLFSTKMFRSLLAHLGSLECFGYPL